MAEGDASTCLKAKVKLSNASVDLYLYKTSFTYCVSRIRSFRKLENNIKN